MTDLLHVNDLSLSIAEAQPVVRGLQLSISPGESVGLVGPSGSGKSLTTLALLGLLPAGARVRGGVAAYTRKDGRSVNLLELREGERSSIRGREIGLVFQEPLSALNPILRCGRQLRESVRRLDPDADGDQRVDELLGQVGLHSLRDRVMTALPSELSGGELQRLVIAMALAGRPRLLIADEPTTSLDSITEQDIMTLLNRLRLELGMGMLLISHDERLLRAFTDRQVVLARRGAGPSTEACPREPAPGMDGPPIVRVDGLCIDYGAAQTPAVRDFALTIRPGEWVALVGPSGCGKSTVAGWLSGLIPASSGTVEHRTGKLPATASGTEIRRLLGTQVIFQDVYGSLNPRHTVGRALAEVLVAPGGDTVDSLLAGVDLSPADYASRYPPELSGGERQRVAIARALAAAPRLLICDEAFSGLDTDLRTEVLDVLDRVCRARHINVLLITHNLDTALARTDTLLIMEAGRIVEEGSTAEVLRNPESDLGRRFAATLR